jgi:hypothetical protein
VLAQDQGSQIQTPEASVFGERAHGNQEQQQATSPRLQQCQFLIALLQAHPQCRQQRLCAAQ